MPRGIRTASEWAWRALVIGAALVAVLYLTGLLSEVVIPILVAMLLAALLQPIYHALTRVMPRGAAAGITVFGTLAVVFGMLSFVGTQLTSQITDIGTKVTDGIDQIRQWLNTTFGITDTQLEGYIGKLRDWVSSGNLTDTAASAGLTATHIVAGFFLAMFSLYFFLYDGPLVWGWVVRLFPRTAREKVHSSGLIAWTQLSAFTRATLIVAAVDAAGIGIGAAILGVPFASGIALLVFFGAFIPVVGAAVSGAVAVLLALVALGPIQALIMLGIILGRAADRGAPAPADPRRPGDEDPPARHHPRRSRPASSSPASSAASSRCRPSPCSTPSATTCSTAPRARTTPRPGGPRPPGEVLEPGEEARPRPRPPTSRSAPRPGRSAETDDLRSTRVETRRWPGGQRRVSALDRMPAARALSWWSAQAPATRRSS